MELKKVQGVFKDAFIQLNRNEPLILASATAFFTLFSLTPILVILLNILSILFRNNKITESLFQPIEKVFGTETFEQYDLLLKILNYLVASGI